MNKNNFETINKICPKSLIRNFHNSHRAFVKKLKQQETDLSKLQIRKLMIIVKSYKLGFEFDEIEYNVWYNMTKEKFIFL